MKVKVKPTAGGAVLEVELKANGTGEGNGEGEAPPPTVADVKREVLAQRPELGDVRLIYRGQILKDERTVASYGG